MNKTSMSLHRVMAEIKSIEEKLSMTAHTPLIAVVFGEPKDEAAKLERAGIIVDSKAGLDKINNLIANLSVLKAARNKANSTVQVSIAGKTMTIDEALAQKASIPHKQALVDTILRQSVEAQRKIDTAQREIETKVASQLAAMFTGTRKASDEELNVIRGGFERSLKPVLLAAADLKIKAESLKKEISDFTTEIDYVLSEVNATTKVDVDLF